MVRRSFLPLPVLLALLVPSEAAAHATLLTAVPPDGAVLPAPPAALVLTYNEPVRVLAAAIALPDGRTENLAVPPAPAATVSIALPGETARGTRGVTVRVASADGHVVATSLLVSVGAPSPGVVAPDPENDGVRSALWLARALALAALFFGAGGAFHTAVVERRAARPGRALALVGAVAAVLVAGLHGIDAVGGGFGLLATLHPWAAAWATGVPWFAAFVLAALVSARLAAAERPAVRIAGAVAAVLAAGAALAAGGHAAAAEPHVLTRTALVAHGVALAVWLGALPPLARAAASGADVRAALARFSALAPVAVAALAFGGAALAVVQVTTPSDLWTTAYGRVLSAKLVLVACMLALAGWNRWRLTGAVRDGRGGAARRFRAATIGEAVLAAGVLGLVSLFQFTPPPRALAAAAAEPLAVHIHTEPAMADITIAPGRAGPVAVTAILMTGDFGPLAARNVTIALDDPVAGGAPIAAPATLGPEGYVAPRLVIPTPGRWRLTVTGDVDGRPFRLDTPVDIRP